MMDIFKKAHHYRKHWRILEADDGGQEGDPLILL